MIKLLVFIFLVTPLYAGSAVEKIEEIAQNIRAVRLGSTEETLLTSFNTHLKEVDHLLDGTSSSISNITARPPERLTALAALFQQRLVKNALKEKNHEIKVYSNLSNLPIDFNHKLRSFESAKNEIEKQHLMALYVMKKGIKLLAQDPLLALKKTKFLEVMKQEISVNYFSRFLNEQAFHTLFPEGLFMKLAPFAISLDFFNDQHFKDAETIAFPIMMGLAHNNTVVSKNNFILPFESTTTFKFFTDAESKDPLYKYFLLLHSQPENDPHKKIEEKFPLFKTEEITDKERYFYNKEGARIFEIDGYAWISHKQISFFPQRYRIKEWGSNSPSCGELSLASRGKDYIKMYVSKWELSPHLFLEEDPIDNDPYSISYGENQIKRFVPLLALKTIDLKAFPSYLTYAQSLTWDAGNDLNEMYIQLILDKMNALPELYIEYPYGKTSGYKGCSACKRFILYPL